MSDTDLTPPTAALAPEEWAKAHGGLTVDASGDIYWGESAFSMRDDSAAIPISGTEDDVRRHALAALCLYQQPFGFTQEDVADELDLADSWEQEAELSERHMNGAATRGEDFGMWGKNAEDCRRRAALARSRAARIAALLPEEPR